MKILIAEACTIAGEEVSTHAEIGDVADVSKDDALLLARMGRAYLVNRDDVPKGQEQVFAHLVATGELKEQVKRRAAAARLARESREQAVAAASPDGMAAMVAAAVAQAVSAALKPAEPIRA